MQDNTIIYHSAESATDATATDATDATATDATATDATATDATDATATESATGSASTEIVPSASSIEGDDTVNKYLISFSCQQMLDAISAVYRVDDYHFNICATVLERTHILHADFNAIVAKITDFIKANEEMITNRQPLAMPILKLTDEAYANIQYFCGKQDMHTDTLYQHLSVILFFANKGISKEEIYLNKVFKSFAPKCKQIAEYIRDNQTNVTDDANMDMIVNTFKPGIKEFNNECDEYNSDIMVKIIFIRAKIYLNKIQFADVFGPKIDRASIMELIDMGIVDDLEKLDDNKFEILKVLSKSGLLSHFKIPNIMSSFNIFSMGG